MPFFRCQYRGEASRPRQVSARLPLSGHLQYLTVMGAEEPLWS